MKTLALNLVVAAALVFTPIKATLATAFILVLLDLISGLWAAKKRGEKITSTGLKRTVIKLLAYEVVIMLGYLTEQYMTGDLVPVVKILGGLVGLTELKSVLENAEEITGIPLIQVLIDKLNQSDRS